MNSTKNDVCPYCLKSIPTKDISSHIPQCQKRKLTVMSHFRAQQAVRPPHGGYPGAIDSPILCPKCEADTVKNPQTLKYYCVNEDCDGMTDDEDRQLTTKFNRLLRAAKQTAATGFGWDELWAAIEFAEGGA